MSQNSSTTVFYKHLPPSGGVPGATLVAKYSDGKLRWTASLCCPTDKWDEATGLCVALRRLRHDHGVQPLKDLPAFNAPSTLKEGIRVERIYDIIKRTSRLLKASISMLDAGWTAFDDTPCRKDAFDVFIKTVVNPDRVTTGHGVSFRGAMKAISTPTKEDVYRELDRLNDRHANVNTPTGRSEHMANLVDFICSNPKLVDDADVFISDPIGDVAVSVIKHLMDRSGGTKKLQAQISKLITERNQFNALAYSRKTNAERAAAELTFTKERAEAHATENDALRKLVADNTKAHQACLRQIKLQKAQINVLEGNLTTEQVLALKSNQTLQENMELTARVAELAAASQRLTMKHTSLNFDAVANLTEQLDDARTRVGELTDANKSLRTQLDVAARHREADDITIAAQKKRIADLTERLDNAAVQANGYGLKIDWDTPTQRVNVKADAVVIEVGNFFAAWDNHRGYSRITFDGQEQRRVACAVITLDGNEIPKITMDVIP